jgi:UDP-N-acetyl-D-mannosaminuronic acid dehydrogenase
MSNNGELRVAVLGLGHVGLPLAALLATNGFRVLGFDINSSVVSSSKEGLATFREPGLDELLKRALGTNRFTASGLEADLGGAGVFIIAVGTPWDDNANKPDLSQLEATLQTTGRHMATGCVVILKSTVIPGTCDELVIPTLERVSRLKIVKDFGVAFSPERIIEGRAIEDFQTLPKILGSTDNRSFEVASKVLGALGGKILRVSNTRTAEMVKMLDNYNRDGSIALINQFALFCEAANVDVLEVIRSAKSDYPRNAGVLLPGGGVGGSCLNKDPWLLDYFSRREGIETNLIRLLRWRNSEMPKETTRLVRLVASRLGIDRPNITIAGFAFKSNTDDTRYSPAVAVRRNLARFASKIVLTDPYVKSLKEHGIKDPVLPDIYTAAKGADILVFAADHVEYRTLDLPRLMKLMSGRNGIVDSRHVIDPRRAISLGFEFEGIGRPKGAFTP